MKPRVTYEPVAGGHDYIVHLPNGKTLRGWSRGAKRDAQLMAEEHYAEWLQGLALFDECTGQKVAS